MDENITSKIFSWLKEHLILLLVVAIIIVISLFFIIKPKENLKFELYGNAQVNVYLGNQYYEYGYYLSNKEYSVKVISDVDTNRIGQYRVRYRLLTKEGEFKLEKVRMVNVIEDPLKGVSLTLNGNNPTHVLLNNNYEEKGATAIYNGTDISSNVIISGKVNSNNVGNYEVKYTIKMDNREKTISRFVQVFAMLFDSEVDYNNKKIEITVQTPDFDYVLLPDNNKSYEDEFFYNYTNSGTNTFTVYTKSGYSQRYEVTVLDKIKPTGSCTAKINGESTEVTITANDESGINRYTYGSSIFKTNQFTISQKLQSFLIRVYDNSENYIDVECKTRKRFNNNMDEIKTSNDIITCNGDWSKYNSELANLVLEYGPKTRDAVAASAEYLAKFPYMITYSWGGKSRTPGINQKWGCTDVTRRNSENKLVCTKIVSEAKNTCIYGMDCTGYTAWAYINAGFDPDIIRTSSQSTGMWGEFNASNYKYSFTGNPDKVAQIKPGDIVHYQGKNTGHVGIVLGTDETRLKVANMVGGIKITYLNKKTGASLNGQHSFTHFVLMDKFFEKYENKYE